MIKVKIKKTIKENDPQEKDYYETHKKQHGEENSEYIGLDGKTYKDPWDPPKPWEPEDESELSN
jgi:hypothetical protein